MRRIAKAVLFPCLLLAAGVSFSQDPAAQEVTVSKLADGIYRLTCPGFYVVNIIAFTGDDGTLLVDTGYAATSGQVRSILEGLGAGNIRYVVNTHTHGDHTGGNADLAQGATVLAHADIRPVLLGEYFAFGRIPQNEWFPVSDSPIVTTHGAFSLLFNGQEIRMIPYAGHAGSDLIVHFVDSKIVYMGDLLFADEYPTVDVNAGGDIETFAKTIESLTDSLPGDVILVPGHGSRNYSIDDLRNYRDMMAATTAVLRAEVEAGKTSDEIDEAVLEDWSEWGQGPDTDTARWIRDVSRSLAQNDQAPRRSIAEPLTRTILDSGVQAAIAQYRELEESQPTAYRFTEGDINILGYQLMGRGMLDEALEIFKLYVEKFPDAFNAYDSLGEAYMVRGELAPAIANYEKSLELNPDNTNAVNQLDRIRGQ
jgi:glyoxylase-like metal-dependent hydrolase (beta-lactamase superfamily II)